MCAYCVPAYVLPSQVPTLLVLVCFDLRNAGVGWVSMCAHMRGAFASHGIGSGEDLLRVDRCSVPLVVC